MKQYINLSNIDRARLIHQWFPDEIAAFLEYAQHQATDLQQNREQHKKGWIRERHLFDFSYWVSSAVDMQARINKYKPRLVKSYRLFGDQLFSMEAVFFTVDCLYGFAQEGKASFKLREAILFFFYYETGRPTGIKRVG